MNEQSQSLNATDLLSFLWKYRKLLIIIGAVAVVVSSIVALVIEEKFRSTVILYPAKSSSVVYNDVVLEDQDVAKFGEEEEAEQMLQILESAAIREEVINKFNLVQHYEIDTASPYMHYELTETYNDLINFSRNNKGAVIIDVLDKSKDTATLIAGYISELYNQTKNDIIHERAAYDYEIKKAELEHLLNEKNMVNDTMSKLTSLGVVTQEAYEAQTMVWLNAKDQATKDEYKQKLTMTEKYGSVLKNYEIKVEFLEDRIATLSSIVMQAKTNATADNSHKFIIESATVPVKKAYPIRWLIVVVSTVSTVLLTIILLLFYEKIKELRVQD